MDFTPMLAAGLILLGVLVGTLSGMLGIGGGIFVIPSLMFVFGFTQLKANGTSLAMMLPPIGIFAVLSYSRAGNIDWRAAMLLAVGFAAGAFAGAKIINRGWINPDMLRILFALLLVFSAVRMLPKSPDGRAMNMWAMLALVGATALFILNRMRGRPATPGPGGGGNIATDHTAASTAHDYDI